MVKKVPLGKLLIEQKERIGTENAGGLPLLGVNNKVGLHRSTGNKIKDLSNYKIVQRNWFAYNPMRINVGSLGLALTDEQVGVVSPDYVVFSCGENLSPHYLYRFLKSLTGMTEIRKNTTGTVRERLYFKSLAKIEIPLPSILEQIDISNKLRSMESILQQTIDENSEQLTTVNKLRQAILQLAVQGKLVPQNPKDEPASVLLEKIKAQKDDEIRKRRYRKVNNLPKISDNEKLINIPKSWHWNRIGDVLIVIRGASPRPKGDPRYFSIEKTDYHWIKISDIRKYAVNRVLKSTDEYLTQEGARKSVLLPKGTFILSNSATIGVPVFLGIEGCIHDGYLAFPFIPDDYFDKNYLYYFFLNLKQHMHSKARGLAQLNLNIEIVRNLIIATPPLNEQRRIVAKVDELMALCDELETRLSKSQTDCDKLMEAAVAEILAA